MNIFVNKYSNIFEYPNIRYTLVQDRSRPAEGGPAAVQPAKYTDTPVLAVPGQVRTDFTCHLNKTHKQV